MLIEVSTMSCCCDEKKTIRDEDSKKDLIVRMNRIIGSMNGVKNMIFEDRYCTDILIQLAAIDKSIKSLSSVILESHMNSCVSDGIKNGDNKVIEEVVDLFKRFN